MHSKGCALTLLLEGEVLCEMPALVVASQQEERVRVDQLERPQVDDALQQQRSLD